MSPIAALFLLLAGINGAIAVLAGAWAAHDFGPTLVAGGDVLAETASRFQLWHALALLAVALAYERAAAPSRNPWPGSARVLLLLAGLAFLVGIAGFSFGLYGAAVGAATSHFAPIGGMALIVGWLLLALAGLACLLSRRG